MRVPMRMVVRIGQRVTILPVLQIKAWQWCKWNPIKPQQVEARMQMILA